MKIKTKILDKTISTPALRYAKDGDAGIDLTATAQIELLKFRKVTLVLSSRYTMLYDVFFKYSVVISLFIIIMLIMISWR